MKALEFWATVNPDNTLTLPPEIAAAVSHAQQVRVMLLLAGEAEADKDWTLLTADEFLKGYADGDAIYDELPSR